MSFKKTLANLPIETEDREIVVKIKFNGRTFYGYSSCHPDDKNFYSEKVGTTIAHMRAMREAIRFERNKAHTEWKILNKAYKDATQNCDGLEVDPYGTFYHSVKNAEKRYHRYQKYFNEISDELRNYLKDQSRAVASIKRQREMKAKSN